jgi:hypothetical protein
MCFMAGFLLFWFVARKDQAGALVMVDVLDEAPDSGVDLVGESARDGVGRFRPEFYLHSSGGLNSRDWGGWNPAA